LRYGDVFGIAEIFKDNDGVFGKLNNENRVMRAKVMEDTICLYSNRD
jgi:hypothetical protein